MTFVREHVLQEEWEFFNALNIQFEREHITADKYTTWVIDRERKIIFTTVCWGGRDYGETYILIWGKARVYIYIESRFTILNDGTQEYRWLIEKITAPRSLKDKRDELISLIRELADINFTAKSTLNFRIYKMAEPQFVEGE